MEAYNSGLLTTTCTDDMNTTRAFIIDTQSSNSIQRDKPVEFQKGYDEGYQEALDKCVELADDYEHPWDIRAAILRLKEKQP